jgi:hypothetical protein
LYEISFWQRKIITVMSEWKKFISLTHCTLIFQHSHHLWINIFSVILSICSFRWPFNFSFNFGNKKNSDGAKSTLSPIAVLYENRFRQSLLTLLLKGFEHWTETKHEYTTPYRLLNACAKVSFLALPTTPLGRTHLSIKLRRIF